MQRAGEVAVEATGDAVRARGGTQVDARRLKIEIGGEVLVERTGHDAAGYCALRQVGLQRVQPEPPVRKHRGDLQRSQLRLRHRQAFALALEAQAAAR